MTNETERYKYILKKSGLSKKDFAASLGLSMSMNSQIMSGRLKLPRDLLEKLSTVHKINLQWYITGEGSPHFSNNSVLIELIEQKAAAGCGTEVDDYPEIRTFRVPRSLIAPHSPKCLKAVHVRGDSMIGENINDGDIAIFHPGITEGNGIYVVSAGNSLFIKRVDFDPANQTIELISANPAYEPRRYTGHETEDIRISGRVIACYHRI